MNGCKVKHERKAQDSTFANLLPLIRAGQRAEDDTIRARNRGPAACTSRLISRNCIEVAGGLRSWFGVVAVVKSARPQLTSRFFGLIAFIGGLATAAISLLADSIGVSGGGEGLGWKQLIGAIFGGAIALLGLGTYFRSSRESGDA